MDAIPDHEGLGVEPAAFVEEASQSSSFVSVVLDGAFIVDGVYESLVGDEKKGHTGGFVDAPALGFDDSVLDLVAAAEAVPAADFVGLENHGDLVLERLAVDGDWPAFSEFDGDFFGFDLN